MTDESKTAIAIIAIVVSIGVPGIVACFWLWAWRGRANADSEDAYRKLAEGLADAQRRTAFELGQIAEDVGDMRTRVVELERILREVQ